eukprot:9671047-Karenia_brevis.AAC.1
MGTGSPTIGCLPVYLVLCSGHDELMRRHDPKIDGTLSVHTQPAGLDAKVDSAPREQPVAVVPGAVVVVVVV